MPTTLQPAKQPALVLQLPSHLLTAVFSQAPPDALPALRLACKAFLQPANEAARSLKLRRVDAVRLSDFCSLREVDATEAAADGWSEGWLDSLAEQAPRLEVLALGRHHALTSARAAALARFACLRRLDLSGCALSDGALVAALGGLRRLRECDLSMCAQLGDAALAALANGCPELSRLDLTGCERFSEAGLRLLGRLPLRSLILSACCQLTDGCLAAISQGMPQLRCLGLFEAGEEVTDEGLSHLARLKGGLTALDLGYSCWSHSAAGLAALLGQMSQLRMLNIGGCEGTNDGVVATVARHCSLLRELDISESQRVTAAGVRQLGQLPNLEELNLGWNIRLRDEALDSLPPSLTKLDLSFCGEVTDRGLAHVARLPRLASLNLRKCGRVSDEGVRRLSACASLSHLDLSYSQVTSAGLAALRPLRALASLTLVDCIRAVSPPCMMLLTELPGLEALDLSDNKRLDDGSMQALSHAPRLRSLAINSCTKVTDRGLLALCRSAGLRHLSVDRCPQLGAPALGALQRKLVLLRLARPAGGRHTAILEY